MIELFYGISCQAIDGWIYNDCQSHEYAFAPVGASIHEKDKEAMVIRANSHAN